MMREIRNSNGRLVCRIEETTGMVEIKTKDCTTLINRDPSGTTEIINIKNSTK